MKLYQLKITLRLSIETPRWIAAVWTPPSAFVQVLEVEVDTDFQLAVLNTMADMINKSRPRVSAEVVDPSPNVVQGKFKIQ